MLPKSAFQMTEVLVAVPWTLALNCSVPSVVVEADVGEMVIELAAELEPVPVGEPTEEGPGFVDDAPHPDDPSGMPRIADRNRHARLRFSNKDFMYLPRVPFNKVLVYNTIQTNPTTFPVGGQTWLPDGAMLVTYVLDDKLAYRTDCDHYRGQRRAKQGQRRGTVLVPHRAPASRIGPPMPQPPPPRALSALFSGPYLGAAATSAGAGED